MNPEEAGADKSIEEKCSKKFEVLRRESRHFSYKEAVQKTPQHITANCTPEMEDLFKRIFDVETSQRITFEQLKNHPVFADGPQRVIEEERPRRLSGDSLKRPSTPLNSPKLIPDLPSGGVRPRNPSNFQTECKILELQCEQVELLQQIVREMEAIEDKVGTVPCLVLAYNLQKYQIILFKKLLSQQKTSFYVSKYPRYQWASFFESEEYQTLRKEQELKMLRSTL